MKSFIVVLQTLISPAQARDLGPVIYEMSRQANEDPYLIAGIIYVESRFKPGICFKGAFGLMQIQLERRKDCSINSRLRAEWLDLKDPRTNIRRGIQLVKLWRNWCKKHHNSHHWLLHYNQGFGRCPKRRCRCSRRERIPLTFGRVGGYARRVLEVASTLRARQLYAQSFRKASPEETGLASTRKRKRYANNTVSR